MGRRHRILPKPRYPPGSYNSELIYYLASYLGLPAPDNTLRFAKVFICPGFQISKAADNNASFWHTNYVYCVPGVGSSDGIGGSSVWGPGNPPLTLPTGGPIFGYTSPEYASSKLGSISVVRPLTDVWALADYDQKQFNPNNPPGEYGAIPVKPVHGGVRNYLYLDGHTTTRKVLPPSANGTYYW